MTVLYQSATIGIPAVGVSLLMIGGEFDLTAGVAVTTSSLVASMFATQVVGNMWAGVIFALFFSLGIGALNGYLLLRTRLPSFLVTLSTFLMLQGLNIAKPSSSPATSRPRTSPACPASTRRKPCSPPAYTSAVRTCRSPFCIG